MTVAQETLFSVYEYNRGKLLFSVHEYGQNNIYIYFGSRIWPWQTCFWFM